MLAPPYLSITPSIPYTTEQAWTHKHDPGMHTLTSVSPQNGRHACTHTHTHTQYHPGMHAHPYLRAVSNLVSIVDTG